jgi:hypothetical protein
LNGAEASRDAKADCEQLEGSGSGGWTVNLLEARMPRLPRRFSHFIYGAIQSGLTCAIAAAIASVPFWATGAFVSHWLQSWLVAWLLMLPVVLLAAPAIRSLTHVLTRED